MCVFVGALSGATEGHFEGVGVGDAELPMHDDSACRFLSFLDSKRTVVKAKHVGRLGQ